MDPPRLTEDEKHWSSTLNFLNFCNANLQSCEQDPLNVNFWVSLALLSTEEVSTTRPTPPPPLFLQDSYRSVYLTLQTTLHSTFAKIESTHKCLEKAIESLEKITIMQYPKSPGCKALKYGLAFKAYGKQVLSESNELLAVYCFFRAKICFESARHNLRFGSQPDKIILAEVIHCEDQLRELFKILWDKNCRGLRYGQHSMTLRRLGKQRE